MFAGTKFREIEINDPMSFLFLFYKITLINNFKKTNMLSLLDSCITLKVSLKVIKKSSSTESVSSIESKITSA